MTGIKTAKFYVITGLFLTVSSLFPVLALADVLQPIHDTADTTHGNSWQLNLGTGFTGNASGLNLYFSALSATTISPNGLTILQYSDAGYTSQVGQCEFQHILSAGTYPAGIYSSGSPTAISGFGCIIEPSSYIQIDIGSGATGVQQFTYYGASTTPADITSVSTPGGAVAVPFYQIIGMFGGSGVSSIDWNALYIPLVFSTSSAAIGASSTLWGAFASTTSLVTVCDSGNVFIDAPCYAIAYLIVPNPNLLNGLVAIPGTLSNYAPFSFIGSVQSLITTFMGEIATSTPAPNTWHYQSGGASSTLTVFDASSSVADFPLITTMKNYAGDMIYIGWGVSVMFLVFKLV